MRLPEGPDAVSARRSKGRMSAALPSAPSLSASRRLSFPERSMCLSLTDLDFADGT
jgi:hypothetical protein